MKKLLIFASGSAQSGGSGFQKLVEANQDGILQAEIVGVVSNYEHGGVREKADRLGIPFIFFEGTSFPEEYQEIALSSKADFFALSGWLKLVKGLNPKTKFNSKTVFNIHPGPLPEFGGKGMYGHYVHETVLTSYKKGEVTTSAVSMHFVDQEYDHGPVFFKFPVKIRSDDTPNSLGQRVNLFEHLYQSVITDMVVNGEITWDGKNPNSLYISHQSFIRLRHLQIQTSKRSQGEKIKVDITKENCQPFGFCHGDLAVNPSGIDVVFIGVAPGNDNKNVLWYVMEKRGTQGIDGETACYWGGEDLNLKDAGFKLVN